LGTSETLGNSAQPGPMFPPRRWAHAR
jgi:hypothetical protein